LRGLLRTHGMNYGDCVADRSFARYESKTREGAKNCSIGFSIRSFIRFPWPGRRVLKDRCLSKLDTRNSDQARGIPLGCWGLGPRRVAPEEQRGGGRAIPFVASAAAKHRGGLMVAGANGVACPGRGLLCGKGDR
jgi:hypothetical protein